MKLIPLAALAAVSVTLGMAQDTKPTGLESQQQISSYGIGMNVGKRFRHEFIQIDMEAFMRGFKDAMAGKESAVTEAQLEKAMESLRAEVEQRAQVEAKQNEKTGADFLAANKSKEGVVTLPSGLQYKILKAGTGPKPKATDTVKTHYEGTFIDGGVFDSSIKRGEPATFPVNGVIAGWTEALQLMPVGSKWQLFVPAALGYGDSQTGPIKPNSTLIFEVELLSIEGK